MSTDIIILNHATADIRIGNSLIKKFVKKESLHISRNSKNFKYLSRISKENKRINFGGVGNLVPLISRTGLKTAIYANLGKGNFDGFDFYGRKFYDEMKKEKINLDYVYSHSSLSTAITFIDDSEKNSR